MSGDMNLELRQERAFFQKQSKKIEIPGFSRQQMNAAPAETNGNYTYQSSSHKKKPTMHNFSSTLSSREHFNPYESGPIVESKQSKFTFVTKILKYMKSRHLERVTHPLTASEILDEINEITVDKETVDWLQKEALPNNPKLRVVINGDEIKFIFKPRYQVANGNELLALLKQYWEEGKGAIVYDDLLECYADVEKSLKQLDSHIIYVNNKNTKNLFYRQPNRAEFPPIKEKFSNLWHSINVEGVPEQKMEEYLAQKGITKTSGATSRKFLPGSKSALALENHANPTRKRTRKAGPTQLKTNKHLNIRLNNYSN